MNLIKNLKKFKMEHIDEIIKKLIQLKVHKIHERDSKYYYFLYKDITFCFFNMDFKDSALCKIDHDDSFYIGENNRLLILDYFNKSHKEKDILTKLNQDIRKNKLSSINDNKRIS